MLTDRSIGHRGGSCEEEGGRPPPTLCCDTASLPAGSWGGSGGACCFRARVSCFVIYGCITESGGKDSKRVRDAACAAKVCIKRREAHFYDATLSLIRWRRSISSAHPFSRPSIPLARAPLAFTRVARTLNHETCCCTLLAVPRPFFDPRIYLYDGGSREPVRSQQRDFTGVNLFKIYTNEPGE